MSKKSSIILVALIFFFTLIQTNFFRNFYELTNLTYDERINNAEGFCEKSGVGYINFIKKKYNINEKIQLITADKEPSLWSIFSSNFKSSEVPKHIIIINYKNLKKNIDLNNFKIIDNYNDCYYLTK